MPLTADQAAARLNRTERTVRRWIQEGRLKAYHPTVGRKSKFLLDEQDVDALAQELAQFEDQSEPEQEEQQQGPDIRSLIRDMGKAIEDMSFQIQVLENRIAELESVGSGDVSEVAYTTGHLNRIEDRLDAIEDKLKPVDTGRNKVATQEDIATVLEHNLELDERLKIVEDTLHSPSARSTDTTEPHRAAEPSKRTRNNARAFTDAYEPVEGAILIKDFAELHGVNQNTFRDHVRKGIGPEKEKAPAYSRDKPGRPGEKEYWILPEQQQQVIDFWRRFGVRFTVPAGDDLSQSEQDQEER